MLEDSRRTAVSQMHQIWHQHFYKIKESHVDHAACPFSCLVEQQSKSLHNACMQDILSFSHMIHCLEEQAICINKQPYLKWLAGR